ncbi:hypothetical protein F7P75_10015 [Acinetobacter gandensis]|uniref:Mobilization protein n=1 Tax=Acinetobacter gandensis TaxID=1443941 RepID=A0A1A7R7T5_9GAMM|nr:hypothetical protein [Acinetobacter gandensis]KAB0625897.1 hypothetical protein F7P75_10015 [Acinetobacter gandensis]OBX27951.1 hypothetical protein A9J31_07440 [Acinetobacter gandensis]
MIIKFLPHGKGDPFRAAAYVMDDKDHLNLPRTGVEVLRGDPMTFASIAQSSPHKYRYTSVVIAWAAEDEVGLDEINEVLDAFEQHAFAGLKPHQYHMTAVMHEEENRSRHIHVLIPRLELTTEKSLNIAPPGHRHYFDPLRDYFNHKYEWARPDDPARARSLQLQDHALKQNAAALRANLIEQPKATRIELINQFVEHRMLQGMVYDRPTVLQALSEIGTITRIGQNYISLRTEAGTDRLKAAYYDEQFYLSDYLENQRRTEALGSTSIEDSRKLAERNRALREAEQRIQEVRAKRQQYNERTYRDPEPVSASISHDQRSTCPVEPTIEEATTIQDQSRGGDRTAKQSDERNSLTDAKSSTITFGDLRGDRENQKIGFEFLDVERHTIQRDQPTTQDETRSEYYRRDSAGHRQNTYLYFSAIADTDLQQQSHFNLHQYKRYLNARVPYRVTTPNSTAISVVTTRKSSFEQLLASDEGRDQRRNQYNRIAANLPRQIATIDRTIEQRVTAQGSADPTVSELFIQQHRRARSNKLIQYLGSVIQRVSGYLSPIRTVSNAVSELYRGKTQQLLELFRDTTFDQLGKFAISREKHRKRVRQCAERSHEYEQRFKQAHQFISTALNWSIQRIFPKDNLSHFINNIVQQHPDQDFTMMRVYAERVDNQITDHIRFLMDENKKGNRYPTEEKLKFTREFRLCTEKLIQNIHLFKTDDPNILGFLNTMDHYMQMIDLNHPRPHLKEENSPLINANDASRLDIKDCVNELRSYLEPYGRKRSAEENERKQDVQIVPKTPEPKKNNLRDLEF